MEKIMFNNLKIQNFKSLRNVTLTLKPVNLLIGANGSGKTNLADALLFLSRAVEDSLKNAIEDSGGAESVRRRTKGRGTKTILRFNVTIGEDKSRGIIDAEYGFNSTQAKDIVIGDEYLKADVYKRGPGRTGLRKDKISLEFQRENDKITKWTEDTLGPKPSEIDDDALLLNYYGKSGNLRTIADYIASIKTYNIDAYAMKRGFEGTEKELARYGENVAVFLKKALEDRDLKNDILEDLREVIPYIKNIKPIKEFMTPTLEFEERDSELRFYAPSVSDGTIRLLGLIAVLRQSTPPTLLIIEEPENALHRYAIKTLIAVAHELSKKEKFCVQTLFTSHSTIVADEILKTFKPRTIEAGCFIARRGQDGVSTINKAPADLMEKIADNLGAPSDFLKEGHFDDKPNTSILPYYPDEEGD
jgi:predicted ATPase